MAVSNTYQAIATSTLGSTQTSYTFSSIPQTYTDLILVMNVVPNGTGSGTYIVNGDTSSLYSNTAVVGLDSNTPTSFRANSATSTNWLSSGAALTNSNNLHFDVIQFMNYSNTNTFKTILSRENPGQFGYVGTWVNLYRSTSALTSITMQLSSSFGIGTTFTLYGISAA
jgi:hypothetical protein